MDALAEIRYAFRSLARAPAVTAVAVLALALGIGLTGTMFSIVYGALFRGLPFAGGERIVSVGRAHAERGIEATGVPLHDYLDWRESQTSFEALAANYQGTVNLRAAERPERYDGAFITANGLATLGVQPVLGRLFREDEDEPGAPPVVLLSHGTWESRFGGDPGVLGRTVTVNGEVGEIVGVMPPGFAFPENQEVWLPLRVDPAGLARGEGTWLDVYGRLRPGVTEDRAAAEIAALMARLEPLQPPEQQGFTAVVRPYADRFIGDEPRAMLLTMLGAVFLVLLIACANVANLLLARASTRSRDVAVRTALGASRWRVVRHLMAEAAVLAGLGALLGVGIAALGIELFDRAVAPTNPPFFLVFRLDGPILAFLVGVAALTALLAGGLPALRASSTDVNAVLKDASRGSSSLHIGRLSRGLVVAEIAMSMGLLVVAALMGRGIWTLARQDLPFPTEDVFTARVGLFEAAFPDAESRTRFWIDLEERLAAEPGVRRAALASSLPGQGALTGPVALDGETYPDDRALPRVREAVVTPGFFAAFDAGPVQGRVFTSRDGPDTDPVAVVNEGMARRLFPDGSPVGRRIRGGGLQGERPWRTIVGVVPDLGMDFVGNNDAETIPEGYYVPLAQSDLRFMSIVLRADGGAPLSLAPRVRDVVVSVDADTPIYFVQTLQALIDQNLWFYRVFGTLFGVFGLAALFMASVGLYGVMSFSVSARTREVGVRMALGAEGPAVVRLIVRQGMAQVALGLLLGSGLAVGLGRAMRTMLYQVSATDPAVFTAVATVLLSTALLAVLVPSLRATRVDPVRALSSE